LFQYTSVVATTAQIFPICQYASSDPDGDGYGWENKTCLVGKEQASNVTDTNASISLVCIDTLPLNDGWGWNGQSSCQTGITDESLPKSKPTDCFDTEPLNDGWGWNGYSGCRVAEEDTASEATGPTPYSRNGKLSVCKRDGTYSLCNNSGEPIQLTGMSSHGIQWSGWHTYDHQGCLTPDSLDLLAQNWKTDIFRIALYPENDGYLSNPEEFIRHVNTIIEQLSARGMYAIVDYHILAGMGVSGDPLDYADSAEAFFRRIVRDNRHRKNILYEIANEPQGPKLTWDQIRQYGDRITRAIREEEAADNNAVIIAGTNSWSSFGMAEGGSFLEIVENPINDPANNLMYAFHFYANDPHHIRRGYREALNQSVHHIPVFVSEWGTQFASGSGTNNFDRARGYIEVMKNKNISWTMWNFSDSLEASAVWNDTSFCGWNQDWQNTDNLSASGRFIKNIFDSE